jgi:hypothetical protein
MPKASSFMNTQQLLNPGPGRYNSNESFSRLHSRSPSFTISKAERTMTVTFMTPGPGDYDANKNVVMTKGPTFRIGLKSPIK